MIANPNQKKAATTTSTSEALRSLREKLVASAKARGFDLNLESPSEPVYQCPVCEDRGVVTFSLPLDHPDFGKLHDCPQNCAAVKRRNQQVYEKKRERMLNYFPKQNHNPDATLEEVAHQYGKNFVHHILNQSVALYGTYGTGKTYALSAIYLYFKQASALIAFVRLRDVFQVITGGYDRSSAYSEREAMNAIKNYPMLIIDEFDINHVTPHKMDIVEEIIDHRERLKLYTSITTNMHPDQIASRWGGRTSIRMKRLCDWIELTKTF